MFCVYPSHRERETLGTAALDQVQATAESLVLFYCHWPGQESRLDNTDQLIHDANCIMVTKLMGKLIFTWIETED